VLSVLAMGVAIARVVTTDTARFAPATEGYGSIEGVSELMLGRYIFPFELTGLLLTVAVIGAVMLARREAPGSRGTRETTLEPRVAEEGASDA
jgi:NADH:ubiquinone oxidoreductase subunit 6 (subunit J)